MSAAGQKPCLNEPPCRAGSSRRAAGQQGKSPILSQKQGWLASTARLLLLLLLHKPELACTEVVSMSDCRC